MAAYPHVEWLDLEDSGVLTECAIMKKDGNNNIHFFQVASLDSIDKVRLRNVLVSRNSTKFPLWQLMEDVTLNNGINCLTYFHQLVKVKTPSGQIIDPTVGTIGAAGNVQATQRTPDGAPVSNAPATDRKGTAAGTLKKSKAK
jgi:hypothetical protein